MNICFETFGCRLNRAEALADEAQCLKRGHKIVHGHERADLIVVRGCSVTARAQEDCERLLRHLRRKYPNKRVFVTGCLTGARPFTLGRAAAADDAFEVPTGTSRGYLKVQDGCDSRCTYCIIPTFRGRARSIDFDTVLDRARRFIDAGYHELVVTGCNLVQYRSGERHLPELLSALASLDRDGCRIRLGSLEPGPVTDAVIRVMAEHENICRYLHLAVESASDPVLVGMHRPYDVARLDATVTLASGLMPRLGLGCDLIGGFPGEDRFDHKRTVHFLQRHGFAHVHAFPFSPRPQTMAALRTDQIDEELRRERAHELASTGREIRAKFAQRFVGHRVRIVVENTEVCGGWTGEYLWLEMGSHDRAACRQPLPARRELVTMRVAKADGGRLYGVPVPRD